MLRAAAWALTVVVVMTVGLTVLARLATGAYLLLPSPLQALVRLGDSTWSLVTGHGFTSELGELLSESDVSNLTTSAGDVLHDALDAMGFNK